MANPAAATAYNHSGPPAYVPLSGGAITALVLSVVMVFVGCFGPWWCGIVPLVIVLLCWGGIARGVRRGKVVAILAIVFSLGGGAFCFWTQKAMATGLADGFTPVALALEKGDRAKLEKWAGTDEGREQRIDRWTARAKAAFAAEGGFKGELSVEFMKFGWLYGIASKPNYREEFEPKGDKPLGQATIWFRALCANGDVFIAFDYGTLERLNTVISKMKAERATAEPGADPRETLDTAFAGNVDEIRFFR